MGSVFGGVWFSVASTSVSVNNFRRCFMEI